MNEETLSSVPYLSKDTRIRIIAASSELPSGMVGHKSDAVYLCAHGSSSMNPSLCQLDLLEVVPYGNRPVKVGDVILFKPPGEDQPIVHRVVNVLPEGIRTCGDNCIHKDPWLLKPEGITGQVTVARRGRNSRKIMGGRLGWLKEVLARWVKVPFRRVALMLHPLYRWIYRFGIFQRFMPHYFKPRVILLQNGGLPQPRLLLGRHVIGWYDDRKRQWHIRRPFRLFVNASSLPDSWEGETVSTKF